MQVRLFQSLCRHSSLDSGECGHDHLPQRRHVAESERACRFELPARNRLNAGADDFGEVRGLINDQRADECHYTRDGHVRERRPGQRIDAAICLPGPITMRGAGASGL